MSQSENSGWIKLTLLWIGSFLDGLFSSTTLNVLVTAAVLVLTVLQIVVTYGRIKRDRHFQSLLDGDD